MFTREKAPLIIPKPSPETYAKMCLLSVTCILSAISCNPLSVFLNIM